MYIAIYSILPLGLSMAFIIARTIRKEQLLNTQLHAIAYAIACNCRKPGSELFFNAAIELNIDLQQSWMIGDILNDVEAGNKAGCKTILIDNGNETEWELHRERIPDYVAHNFLEAVASIKHIAKCESIMYEGKLASL